MAPSTSRGKLHFEPTARLQQFLGRELIADPNVAVGEFVKNSYDAGATEVIIDLFVNGRMRDEQAMIISDNGSGMTRLQFEENWMRPGYSAKAEATAPVKTGRSKPRFPVGEKGVGRLAAARLGQELAVWTRTASNQKWLRVDFDWEKFEKANVPMRDIKVPFSLEKSPEDMPYASGTQVVIERLSIDWRSKLPGRKLAGRSDHRLGRLKEDLEVLLQPLGGVDDFRVIIRTDDPDLNEWAGTITPGSLQLTAGYRLRFTAQPQGESAKVSWTIERAPSIVEATDEPASSSDQIEWVPPQPIEAKDDDEEADDEEVPPTLVQCGAFTGEYYYAPPQVGGEKAPVQPGVLVYRDGIRVEPYGRPDDDWLGVKAKKASRQGYAAIQPKRLSGFVSISRTDNDGLVDMSNRLGLVENDAYEHFVAICGEAFLALDKVVFKEVVEPNWEKSEDRQRAAAERAKVYTDVIVRSRVHNMRQPLQTLSQLLLALKVVVQRDDLPEDLREQLRNIAQQFDDELSAAHGQVTDLLALQPDLRFEDFPIGAAVDSAVDRLTAMTTFRNANIVRRGSRTPIVSGPRQSLEEGIHVVIQNAIEVDRPEGLEPVVEVRTSKSGDWLRIEVQDNGVGMSDEVRERMFEPNFSTKGGTGAGLSLAMQTLALLRGRIEVMSTGPDGTTVRIEVPTRAAVRKEARLAL